MNRESDAETDAIQSDLERRTHRLAVYLCVRGWVGLGVVALGVAAATLALSFLLVGIGVLDIPPLALWTEGFGIVLAPFLPGAIAFILVRTGLAYWRARTLESPDTGCLAG